MIIITIIGVATGLVVPMIIGCAFLTGKSKKFMDKLSGNHSDKEN